ncbi:MAG: hypothetical protein IT289_05130 [Oligoflexia bacterium]|nr:hypothetical protein [Oligoflexia bacterium]
MSKKRAQLVTQYLEGISSKALENYQHVIKQYSKNRHGIYALYKGTRLYYVGLASRLRGRLRSHLRDRHTGKWDRFSIYLTLRDHHMKDLESLILRIAKTKGNKIKGKFTHAENLHRRFRSEVFGDLKLKANFLLGKVDDVNSEKGDLATVGGTMKRYGIASLKIRGWYKGKEIRAYVKRDGTIRLKGKTFNSPSLAAGSIVKRAINGWDFWHYQRAPGDWVPIDELRD